MKIDDHPVKTCTTLGHHYASVTVQYCDHVQGYLVLGHVWSDTDDEPVQHFRSEVGIGPFDTNSEISNQMVSMTRQVEQVLRSVIGT